MKGTLRFTQRKRQKDGIYLSEKGVFIVCVGKTHLQLHSDGRLAALVERPLMLQQIVVEFVERFGGKDDGVLMFKKLPVRYENWKEIIDRGLIDREVEFKEVLDIPREHLLTDSDVERECMKHPFAELVSKRKGYEARELEIVFAVGLLNRPATINELTGDFRAAKEKFESLKLAIDRGDFDGAS